MSSYDVLVLGEVNVDLILQGNVDPEWNQVEKLIGDASLTLGGSSTIFACGAARLGLKVGMISVLGDDMFGRFCIEQLQQHGVDTSGIIIDPTIRTGITVHLQKPDDRAMLTYLGTISELRADRIDPNLLKDTRHIHVGSFFMQTNLQPDLIQLFDTVRAAGVTTSVDPGWDPAAQWEPLINLLPHMDIFIPNEGEACELQQSKDWREALTQLTAIVPTVALKRGAEGAAAAQGETIVEATPPKAPYVDAVGAGDSFSAGFVYAMLAGWPLERCVRMGVVCGTCSTRAAGGTAAQATLEEALSML